MSSTLHTPAPNFDDVWRALMETRERQQETDRMLRESRQEADLQTQETKRILLASKQETDRMLKNLGEQIGGLGDKFGYFTEGMALPSMERILNERFQMDYVMPRARSRKGGRSMEIDVLAWANGEVNRVVLVEVKSRVKREAIEQIKQMLLDFAWFYPEHSSKVRTGILAGVDWDQGVQQEAQEAGLLTACIHDQIFELHTPPSFAARDWSKS